MGTVDHGDDLLRRLEAARRRLRESMPGSPEEDAAWNAVQRLEEALADDGPDEPQRADDVLQRADGERP